MSEKLIKISAVFTLKDEDEAPMMVEMSMTYDAEKASTEKATKLDVYNALKEVVQHQVAERVTVLDATADEVKEHYETGN